MIAVKLGFDLLLWDLHVTEAARPILDELKAAGYDGVEIPMFEGDVAHYQKLGSWLRDAGLDSTGIGVIPPARARSRRTLRSARRRSTTSSG